MRVRVRVTVSGPCPNGRKEVRARKRGFLVPKKDSGGETACLVIAMPRGMCCGDPDLRRALQFCTEPLVDGGSEQIADLDCCLTSRECDLCNSRHAGFLSVTLCGLRSASSLPTFFLCCTEHSMALADANAEGFQFPKQFGTGRLREGILLNR